VAEWDYEQQDTSGFAVYGSSYEFVRSTVVSVVAADERPSLIEGTVIYEDVQPEKGATVSAFPLDRALAAKVPSADTDELGHFQINHLLLGVFAVTAKKEDEGYPDTNSVFYSGQQNSPHHIVAFPSVGD